MRRVLANPRLRRVQLAFAGSLLGDWTYATAITVWAYLDAGPAAVGLFTAARYVTTAVAGPLGATVADRVSRQTFMRVLDAARAVIVAVAALVVTFEGPSAAVYALGIVGAAVGAPFRSAQAGFVPALVDDPQDLTAANAVAANIENVAGFAGPALGALLIGTTDVATAFWFNVATFLWSFAMVSTIRVPASGTAAVRPVEPGAGASPGGFLRDASAGFSTVVREPGLRLVGSLSAVQGFIWGALTVFTVMLAVRTLGLGPAGVGFLDAALGVGTVVGGAVVLTRVTRGRLASDMGVGVVGWSLPLLAIAAFPSPVTVVAALAVIGIADPWVNVGLETIPQRIAPEGVVSRVYAAVESALIGAMALGAAVAPVLVHLAGLRWSLALVGSAAAAYTLTTFGRLRQLDRRLAAPEGLALLRESALFAPLSPAVQESLAHGLRAESYAEGDVILMEGRPADSFYLIRSGTVRVTSAGRPLRDEGPGDFFGEIALLHDVPRTASVTAVTPLEVWSLGREEFLGAVTGHGAAHRAAEDVISRRLGV